MTRALPAGLLLVALTQRLPQAHWWWRALPVAWVDNQVMASYSVNQDGVARARRLISSRQYVLDSNWGEVAPTADDENAFLKSHSWADYGAWHLGLTDGANDGTKARYAFGGFWRS